MFALGKYAAKSAFQLERLGSIDVARLVLKWAKEPPGAEKAM